MVSGFLRKIAPRRFLAQFSLEEAHLIANKKRKKKNPCIVCVPYEKYWRIMSIGILLIMLNYLSCVLLLLDSVVSLSVCPHSLTPACFSPLQILSLHCSTWISRHRMKRWVGFNRWCNWLWLWKVPRHLGDVENSLQSETAAFSWSQF